MMRITTTDLPCAPNEVFTINCAVPSRPSSGDPNHQGVRNHHRVADPNHHRDLIAASPVQETARVVNRHAKKVDDGRLRFHGILPNDDPHWHPARAMMRGSSARNCTMMAAAAATSIERRKNYTNPLTICAKRKRVCGKLPHGGMTSRHDRRELVVLVSPKRREKQRPNCMRANRC